MVKVLFLVLALIAVHYSLTGFFPALRNIAFVLAGFGLTWEMLLLAGVAGLSYKLHSK